MIKNLLRVVGLIVLTVLTLSITVKDKSLFTYVYDVISPGTQYAQRKTEEFFKLSLSSTQAYSKKLFDNSVPKVRDSIKSRQSAIKKSVAAPLENINEDEKEELDELIKSH